MKVNTAEPGNPPYMIDHTDINPLDAVLMFMERAQQDKPFGVYEAEKMGRFDWLESEWEELLEARRTGDQVEIDDALVDIIWQAMGYLLKRRGSAITKEIMDEVTRANISKVEPVNEIVFYPGTTKVGKKPTWVPPMHLDTYARHGLETNRAL